MGLEEIAAGLGPHPIDGAEQHNGAIVLRQAGGALGEQRDQGRAEAGRPLPSSLNNPIELGQEQDEGARPSLELLVSPTVESSRLGGGGGMEDSGHARRAQGRHRREPREAGEALAEVLSVRCARRVGVPQAGPPCVRFLELSFGSADPDNLVDGGRRGGRRPHPLEEPAAGLLLAAPPMPAVAPELAGRDRGLLVEGLGERAAGLHVAAGADQREGHAEATAARFGLEHRLPHIGRRARRAQGEERPEPDHLAQAAPPAKVEPQRGVRSVTIGGERRGGALELDLPAPSVKVSSGQASSGVHGRDDVSETGPGLVDIAASHQARGGASDGGRDGVEGGGQGVLGGRRGQCLGRAPHGRRAGPLTVESHDLRLSLLPI